MKKRHENAHEKRSFRKGCLRRDFLSGTLRQQFALFETRKGLVLMHPGRPGIFERLRTPGSPMQIQQLLDPVVRWIWTRKFAVINKFALQFDQAGMVVTPFGQNTITGQRSSLLELGKHFSPWAWWTNHTLESQIPAQNMAYMRTFNLGNLSLPRGKPALMSECSFREIGMEIRLRRGTLFSKRAEAYAQDFAAGKPGQIVPMYYFTHKCSVFISCIGRLLATGINFSSLRTHFSILSMRTLAFGTTGEQQAGSSMVAGNFEDGSYNHCLGLSPQLWRACWPHLPTALLFCFCLPKITRFSSGFCRLGWGGTAISLSGQRISPGFYYESVADHRHHLAKIRRACCGQTRKILRWLRHWGTAGPLGVSGDLPRGEASGFQTGLFC